jgi:hypothetical protein
MVSIFRGMDILWNWGGFLSQQLPLQTLPDSSALSLHQHFLDLLGIGRHAAVTGCGEDGI